MKAVLFLMICCLVFGYMYGHNNPIIINKIVNQTVIKINETKIICEQINLVNISRVKIREQLKIINFSLDMSNIQEKKLKNLKPKSCNNIGCSDGYFKCKYDIFDVFGWTIPKFSERASSGAADLYYNQHKNYSECLPMSYDGFGKFLKLDKNKWFLLDKGNNTREIFINRTELNISGKLKNISIVENKLNTSWTGKLINGNRTNTFWYLRRV